MSISRLAGMCHVSDTNRDVIRFVRRRLLGRGWRKKWRGASRETRHFLMREVIESHQANRELFAKWRF